MRGDDLNGNSGMALSLFPAARRVRGWQGLALVGVIFMAAFSGPAAAADCGSDETPCETPLGTYHVALPDSAASGPTPAFIYFHGAGGSGKGIAEADFAKALTARGYAVIAPNGLQRPDSRFGPGWFFRPESPGLRDEMAFTRELIADATERFGLDPERIILTGYSIGGSLVWYLACQDADIAAAYTPYAGGFWRPLPQTCDAPVKLLHTHGWRDQTVPLEGRPLRNGAIYQGDIFEGLEIWRATNGCNLLRADEFSTEGRYWKRKWTSCTEGTALELALWPGGHSPPDAEWADMAADWVEETLAAVAVR